MWLVLEPIEWLVQSTYRSGSYCVSGSYSVHASLHACSVAHAYIYIYMQEWLSYSACIQVFLHSSTAPDTCTLSVRSYVVQPQTLPHSALIINAHARAALRMRRPCARWRRAHESSHLRDFHINRLRALKRWPFGQQNLCTFQSKTPRYKSTSGQNSRPKDIA